mmetsp:Transcript_74810/g.173320  ORF Transcript_74810/g.173320 Transcript_74810/m.173320 type:complete len:223 (-) Transcript_74810:569-1237(-)
MQERFTVVDTDDAYPHLLANLQEGGGASHIEVAHARNVHQSLRGGPAVRRHDIHKGAEVFRADYCADQPLRPRHTRHADVRLSVIHHDVLKHGQLQIRAIYAQHPHPDRLCDLHNLRRVAHETARNVAHVDEALNGTPEGRVTRGTVLLTHDKDAVIGHTGHHAVQPLPDFQVFEILALLRFRPDLELALAEGEDHHAASMELRDPARDPLPVLDVLPSVVD